MEKYTQSFLNPIEQAELQKFADNVTMVEAVRKVLLAGIYFNGTLRDGEKANPGVNFAINLGEENRSNEQIGAESRATSLGIRYIQTGFKELEGYKSVPKEEKVEKNKAR